MDHLIKEVTEIHLITYNFNRGSGFTLIWDWYFITRIKQGEHLTPLTSSHWLMTNYDQRIWAGIYMTWTDIQGIQFPRWQVNR